MAKPEKKKSKKDRSKSARAAKPRGSLVALDGTNGAMLRSEAERLAGLCSGAADPAWSLWDASSTFYELRMVNNKVVEQVIRPTGLLDPEIVVKPLEGQVDDAIRELARAKAARFLLASTLPLTVSDTFATTFLPVRAAHKLKTNI